jgi:hypothetical protein
MEVCPQQAKGMAIVLRNHLFKQASKIVPQLNNTKVSRCPCSIVVVVGECPVDSRACASTLEVFKVDLQESSAYEGGSNGYVHGNVICTAEGMTFISYLLKMGCSEVPKLPEEALTYTTMGT